MITFEKTLSMNKYYYLLLLLFVLAACNKQDSPKKAFVDVAGLDPSVKPGDNFFRYVDGKWYDSAKIDADQVGVGSYMFLNIPQKKLLQNILDSVSKSKDSAGSIEQKVGDFYASGLDTTTINQRGYDPLKAILERLDAVTDVPSLMKFVAEEVKVGNTSIINFGIWPDNKNSNLNIAHVTQGGINSALRNMGNI
jgi:putative endopeptidase